MEAPKFKAEDNSVWQSHKDGGGREREGRGSWVQMTAERLSSNGARGCIPIELPQSSTHLAVHPPVIY